MYFVMQTWNHFEVVIGRNLSSFHGDSIFQVVVIFSVLSLFLYFIVYAFTLPETGQAPDYSWLKVIKGSNLSVLKMKA